MRVFSGLPHPLRGIRNDKGKKILTPPLVFELRSSIRSLTVVQQHH